MRSKRFNNSKDNTMIVMNGEPGTWHHREGTIIAETWNTQFPFIVEDEKGLGALAGFYVFRGENSFNKKDASAYFELAPMPGCCGAVVSTGSYKYNSSLDSFYFHNIKLAVAKALGYSLMIATAELRNFPETIGAVKNGNWKLLEPFYNNRTGHDLVLMAKVLSK